MPKTLTLAKISSTRIISSMRVNALKVTFARNLAKKLSPLFYYLILLFQLSAANPENFEEYKAREVLKIRKEKTAVSPTSIAFSVSLA